MDVEGSSGEHFPNWEEAHAYYMAHYHRACMHVLLPSFQTKPKKKKLKTITPSTRRRPRKSSSSSAANYRSMYEDDDPVTPAVVKPAPHPPPADTAHVVDSAPDIHPTPTAYVARSPGTTVNPIEVPSNFPTPVTHQGTPKHRKKVQGPFSPTPVSVAFPTLLKKITNSRKTPAPSTSSGPERFVCSPEWFIYVCDCSDQEGGYSVALVRSLKRKAAFSTNNASGSSVQANGVIEIHTESESDSEIPPFSQPRPFSQPCFCKCSALKSFSSSSATQQDPNPDIDMDAIPEIPRPSPPAQV